MCQPLCVSDISVKWTPVMAAAHRHCVHNEGNKKKKDLSLFAKYFPIMLHFIFFVLMCQCLPLSQNEKLVFPFLFSFNCKNPNDYKKRLIKVYTKKLVGVNCYYNQKTWWAEQHKVCGHPNITPTF